MSLLNIEKILLIIVFIKIDDAGYTRSFIQAVLIAKILTLTRYYGVITPLNRVSKLINSRYSVFVFRNTFSTHEIEKSKL